MIGDTCTAEWLCIQLQAHDYRVLVLDCRSADEYSTCHVTGSLPVVVPSIMLRRLRNGSASVAAVVGVGDTAARSAFADRYKSDHIVLYDTSGSHGVISPDVELSSEIAGDSLVEVLMNRLKSDGCRVSYLRGGFAEFRHRFGNFCIELSSSSSTMTVTPSRHQLRVDDPASNDVLGLSNLRLSSSAPSSSSYLHAQPSARLPDRQHRPTAAELVVGGGVAQPFPVQVLPNLYHGDATTARDLDCLRRHNIRFIVNVTPDVENAFDDDSTLTYMRIAITDHWSENPTSFFTDAINFIEEGREKNLGVLVHCLAGISRSVTVTVAYLIFSRSLSLEDAYDFLRRIRPNISPNFNFMGQLSEFDQTLRHARLHCSCVAMAAPRLNICERCRRQVKTYFSSPTTSGSVADDVICTTAQSSSASSPFSLSSLTSSTSTQSLPSPARH